MLLFSKIQPYTYIHISVQMLGPIYSTLPCKSANISYENLYKRVFCNNTKSLENKTTITSSMSLTYLLRVKL